MTEIFGRAHRVIAWLGRHAHDTWTALRWTSLASWTDNSAFRTVMLSDGWKPTITEKLRNTHHEQVLQNMCETHQTSAVTGSRDILSRSWFKRLWIKQEVWAANELEFRCGTFQFSWEQLQRMGRLFELMGQQTAARCGESHSQSSSEDPFRSLDEPKTQRVTRLKTTYESGEALARALWSTAGSECSEPRDRVYAITAMGEVCGGEQALETGCIKSANKLKPFARRPFLVIDYKKSISSVFQDIVRYAIRIAMCLDVLAVLWRGPGGEEFGVSFGGTIDDEELPSWCPNLSQPLRQRVPYDTKVESFARPSTRCIAPSETEPNVLRLLGVTIGNISATRRNAHVVLNPSFRQQLLASRKSIVLQVVGRYSLWDPEQSPEWADLDITPYSFSPDSSGMRAEDVVVGVEGSEALFVLRPADGSDGYFTLVGLTYADGRKGQSDAGTLEDAMPWLLWDARICNELEEYIVV
ncbi:uncharacterized protein LTR77_004996 [Saxophila tyrrhenica]|uniref:Heterokaryon incompatibility domain-containing protein n=1 Tax=Saxophila tyrrhenica TaxID=1690608 RepID=A0AAV9PF10_9PEZI|nr:hypothetical protein LTR77_004996 [Saxophila tyrrhenica]